MTLWTIPCQAPLSMGFSRQKYWSGFLCPLPGDFPNTGIEPVFLTSPVLAAGSLELSTKVKNKETSLVAQIGKNLPVMQ